MDNIAQRERELLKVAGISDTERLQFLEQSVTRLTNHTTLTQQTLDESRHLELLRWISLCPFTRHHESLSSKRMPSSASWVLNHEKYLRWKASSSSSILILHGIPGSGKSNICSAVVDSYLAERRANPLAAPVAYFYCDDCEFEPERAQASEVMRCILRQMTVSIDSGKPKVHDYLLSKFQRRQALSKLDGMDMTRLNIQDCVELILEVIATDPATIVVDALDTVDKRERSALISGLVEIVHRSSNVVKIFITSRYDDHVFSLIDVAALGSASSTTLTDVTYLETNPKDSLQDMEKYVSLVLAQAIEERRLLTEDPSAELLRALKDRLVVGAGEMFQWVNIQLEYLCQLNQEQDITEALNVGTLGTLDDCYSCVLRTIVDGGLISRQIAIRAFSWLLHMKEALTPEAFLTCVFEVAIADVAKSRKELLSICSGFVLFDSECNTFRFAHQSIQDFIRSQLASMAISGQELVALRCVDTCMEGPLAGSDLADDFGPYKYAALYWAYHCSQAFSGTSAEAIDEKIFSFVIDEPGDVSLSFTAWLEQIGTIGKSLANDHPMMMFAEAMPNPEDSPLFAASVWGLECLLQESVFGHAPVDWDQRNDLGHTSLYLASFSGNVTIARVLLANGADPNTQCGRLGNALYAACFKGHAPVVELLLQHGAAVRGPGAFGSALEACFRGNSEGCAMSLLIHEGILRSVEDFSAASGGAAEAGFLKVLEQLAKSHFASGNPNKIKLKTARAIKGGQVGTLTMFLKDKNDVQDMLPDGSVALAALYGHENVVKLLAGMKMDIEAPCKLGSPLRCAAVMNHESVTRTLIELGAKVNVSDHLNSPLQAASMKGHTRIAKFLIRSGANVNQEGGTYGTALQAATYHGHEDTVEALLDAGAFMGIPGIAQDALQAASQGGHAGLVQLMLDRGFVAPYPLSRPLYLERVPTHRELLGNLLPMQKRSGRLSSQPQMQTSTSARHVAAQISHNETLSSTEDGDLSATDDFSDFPAPLQPRPSRFDYDDDKNYTLEVGISSGSLDTVDLLLSHKSALGIEDGDIVNCLEIAAQKGNVGIFERLVRALQSHVPTNTLLQALQVAAEGANSGILDFGLEQLQMFSDSWDYNSPELLAQLVCRTDTKTREGLLETAATNLPTEQHVEVLGHALVEAARTDDLEFLTFLLKKELQVNKKAMRLALEAACQRGYTAIVSTGLLGTTTDFIRKLVPKCLDIAASNGHVDLVAFLIQHLSERKERLFLTKPLFAAAGNGHVNAVEALIRHREGWEDFTADATRALTIAAFNGHEATVQILLGAGADVQIAVAGVTEDPGKPRTDYLAEMYPSDEDEDGDAEDNAVRRHYRRKFSGHPINALQAALLGLEPSGRMGLHEARWDKGTDAERERVVRLLLSSGSDVNSLGGRKKNPLTVAAGHWSLSVVGALIEAGAYVNAIAEDGSNAVGAAVGREQSGLEILRRLTEAGAHLESEGQSVTDLLKLCMDYFSKDGQFTDIQTLEDALAQGPGAVAQYLLEEVPSTRATGDDNFCSLLQSAIAVGNEKCIDLLLERGIDTNTAHPTNGTALHTAALFGNLPVAERLLNAGADPNVVQGRHQTPLRAAVAECHLPVAKLLLERGARLDQRFFSRYGFDDTSPLLNLAVEVDDLDMLELLINAGADVKSSPEGHLHSLISACDSSSTRIIEHLLDSGAPVNVQAAEKDRSRGYKRYYEGSPLHMALLNARKDVVQLLLRYGADVDADVPEIDTPLQLAAQEGHTELVRLLLQHGADVNRLGPSAHPAHPRRTALDFAAQRGRLSVVEELLVAGAHVYRPDIDLNALKAACRYSDSPDVVELLLEDMFDLEDKDKIIMEAFEHVSNPAMAKLLGEYMPLNVAAFHKACTIGSVPLVTDMLDGGMLVNAEDGSGAQALALASSHLQAEVVQALIDRGANVNHAHPVFGTALSAAIYACVAEDLPQEAQPRSLRRSQPSRVKGYGSRYQSDMIVGRITKCHEVVGLLLASGTLVEAEPKEFGHALHLSCFLGHMKLIRDLISGGASCLSSAGYFGIPLMAAIHANHLEVVELLLEHGGQLEYRHPELGTPLFLACRKRHLGIAELILNSGGDPNTLGLDGSTSLSHIFLDRNSDAYSNLLGSGKREDEVIRQKSVMRAFLGHPSGLQLRGSDLTAAAQATDWIWTPIADLLDYDKDIIIPDEVVISIMESGNTGTDMLQLVLDRMGSREVTEQMLLKAPNEAILSVLLEHKPCCRITTEMAESVRCTSPICIINAFFEHEPSLLPTEAIITQVSQAGQYETYTAVALFETMLVRDPELQFAPTLFEGAKMEYEVAEYLLSYIEDFRLTFEMLESASWEVAELLLQYDFDFRVTEHMTVRLLAKDHWLGWLDIILDREPEMPVGEALFLKALEASGMYHGGLDEFLDGLERHGKRLVYTDAMREAVEEAFPTYSEQAKKERLYSFGGEGS